MIKILANKVANFKLIFEIIKNYNILSKNQFLLLLLINCKQHIIPVDIKQPQSSACIQPPMRVIQAGESIDNIAFFLEMLRIFIIALCHVQEIFCCKFPFAAVKAFVFISAFISAKISGHFRNNFYFFYGPACNIKVFRHFFWRNFICCYFFHCNIEDYNCGIVINIPASYINFFVL